VDVVDDVDHAAVLVLHGPTASVIRFFMAAASTFFTRDAPLS
jgi:hypothetical protein